MRNLLLAVPTAIFFIIAVPSQAQLVETDSTQNGPYTVVTNDDLILGQLAAHSGTSFSAIDRATDVDMTQDQFNAELTNGSTVTTDQNSSDYDGRSGFAGIENSTILTYTLSKPADLTEIDTYSSWGDVGRSQQNYKLYYSTDDGVHYTLLNTVVSPYGSGNPVSVKVSLTGVVADVTNIQFNFGAQENGGVGYTELAVYGVSIPEPQSYALLGLGALAILFAGRCHALRDQHGSF